MAARSVTGDAGPRRPPGDDRAGENGWMKSKKKIATWAALVGSGLGIAALMAYLGGFFVPDKIGPNDVPRVVRPNSEAPRKTAESIVHTITEYYEAVGTVRPRTEARIESQVTGRILEILVRPGDRVTRGALLVVLDDRELHARLEQARHGLASAKARREQVRQAVASARAGYAQAEAAYQRTRTYFDSEAATSQDLERAEAAYLQAKAALQQAQDSLREADARVKQAEQVVKEARVALGYTKIKAVDEGQVAERLAEPGDLAWPGKPLLVLQTRGALRLEAFVREGLIQKVALGEKLDVVLTAQGLTLAGTVEEVIPAADPMTRTFLVKVGLPYREGMFPGMFGRLLVPVARRQVVLVPRAAIQHVGQLEMVTVRHDGRWERIFVKTGARMGQNVEILSGLSGGETLCLPRSNDAHC